MIRLSKSCIGELEKQAVSRVLDKEYLGMGEEVQLFETELASLLERPVVCVSSGTAGISYHGQKLSPGVGVIPKMNKRCEHANGTTTTGKKVAQVDF